VTGNISTTNVSCSTIGGWSFDGPSFDTVVTSFTADGDYILDPDYWTASTFVYFNSPNATLYDFVELFAVVTHNGNNTRYSLFFWDGTMGSLNGCGEHYGTFSASAGDTITIEIGAWNTGNATIQASFPRIFNSL
jgi:hypothetical protein